MPDSLTNSISCARVVKDLALNCDPRGVVKVQRLDSLFLCGKALCEGTHSGGCSGWVKARTVKLGFATSLLLLLISDEGGGGGGLAYLWRCAPCVASPTLPPHGATQAPAHLCLFASCRASPHPEIGNSREDSKRTLRMDQKPDARSRTWVLLEVSGNSEPKASSPRHSIT